MMANSNHICNILVTRHDFTTHSLSYKIVQFGAKNREDGIEWQIKEVRCCRMYNDHVYSGHVYRDGRQQIYLSRNPGVRPKLSSMPTLPPIHHFSGH